MLDATGGGLPIEEWIRGEKLPVNFIPVTITPGGRVHRVGDRWHVPKSQLVKDLVCLFEGGRVKISGAIPHGDLLRDELRYFEKRSTRGGGTVFGAAHGRQDDLVMAMSLGAWWALHNRRSLIMGPRVRTLD